MTTLTYNERNFSFISKEEWLMIANQIASYLTEGDIKEVEYADYLRPQDGAFDAIEESGNFGAIPKHYLKMTWIEWQTWIKVNPPQYF